jgi:hypothetical protein
VGDGWVLVEEEAEEDGGLTAVASASPASTVVELVQYHRLILVLPSLFFSLLIFVTVMM